MKGDDSMTDLNKLEQELTRLQQKKQEILEKQKQLERKLKEEERKARTRSLILFAERMISEAIKNEKAEDLLNLQIHDAQGKDYTPYFQKEVQRIREKLSQTQEQNQNKNQEGETHSFFAESQGSFTEQPSADL